jgi:hypothetical protein
VDNEWKRTQESQIFTHLKGSRIGCLKGLHLSSHMTHRLLHVLIMYTQIFYCRYCPRITRALPREAVRGNTCCQALKPAQDAGATCMERADTAAWCSSCATSTRYSRSNSCRVDIFNPRRRAKCSVSTIRKLRCAAARPP